MLVGELTQTSSARPNVEAGGPFVADAGRRTAIAEAFDLGDIIARYRKETGLPEETAQAHRRELMRFLALSAAAMEEGRVYGMLGAIDDLWHVFVIFTREYAAFCDQVAGRFMHHVPDVEGRSDKSSLTGYQAFLDDYELVYGEPAPADCWPRPNGLEAAAQCEGCKGCDTCHGCTHH